MSNNSNSFEYVFYFMFRTYLWKEDGSRWDEPPTLGFDPRKRKVSAEGIRFESDKRLFRRDVAAGEPLDQWKKYFKLAWQDICQVYSSAFYDGDEQQAQVFCEKALFGVALLVLDEGETVEQHSVSIDVSDDENSQLRFMNSRYSKHLFRIQAPDSDNVAFLQQLVLSTVDDQVFLKNLQLRLPQVSLAPIEEGELAANPIFSVYAFCYGGGSKDWKTSVEKLLVSQAGSKRPPLLSSIFARLIMAQWQFRRIDEAAKILRPRLQAKRTFYTNYADENDGNRLTCARTAILEDQLNEMQILNNEAKFLTSRIQGALRTLDVNAENLARRLEEIRNYAPEKNLQLDFHQTQNNEQLRWKPQFDDIPVLAVFDLSIKKLQDHKAYIDYQVKYLNGLQDRWRLFLQNRQTHSGEYLNTLTTILILLLAGSAGTAGLIFNFKGKGIELDVQNFWIYLIIIALLLMPIVWHSILWVRKRICCWFHRVGFFKRWCNFFNLLF